jgi:hypothetical protein
MITGSVENFMIKITAIDIEQRPKTIGILSCRRLGTARASIKPIRLPRIMPKLLA